MEGDIHGLLGWAGALALALAGDSRNYRSVNPSSLMTAVGHEHRFRDVCCTSAERLGGLLTAVVNQLDFEQTTDCP